MKNYKLINVNKDAWTDIRNMFPNSKSDSKRSVIIRDILGELRINEKLKPELSDTTNDRIVKKVFKRLI